FAQAPQGVAGLIDILVEEGFGQTFEDTVVMVAWRDGGEDVQPVRKEVCDDGQTKNRKEWKAPRRDLAQLGRTMGPRGDSPACRRFRDIVRREHRRYGTILLGLRRKRVGR